MPGRLYDLPYGHLEQFIRRLTAAGLTDYEADILAENKELANRMVDWLHTRLGEFGERFNGTSQIWELLVERAQQRNWPLSRQQLDALKPTYAAPGSQLNHVMVPDIWLGDLATTFHELRLWVTQVHKHTRFGQDLWDSQSAQPKLKFKLRNPDHYGIQPSVKWVALNMIAKRGYAPSPDGDIDRPGLEVLAAAALHPEWATAINYGTIPGVWLPGLLASYPNHVEWSAVPTMGYNRDSRNLSITVQPGYGYGPNYAVPMFTEL